MAARFTHLHTHSHYSLLNALPKVDELVKRAKKYEMTALALTDAGNMYGAVEFYKQCKKAGIKPIIGIDAYMAARTRQDKQAGIDNRRTRLILLARDTQGYKNLIKIVTDSHIEGFYYKPRIDKELLEKYHEGLICISPSFSSEISQAVKNKDLEKAEFLIDYYKKLFGKDNFYIEITHHPEIPNHPELMDEVKKLAKKTKTELVASQEVYYLDPEDRMARQTLMSIQNGNNNDERSFDDSEEDFSFISPEQAEGYFKDIPEALENTAKIAEICNATIDIDKWYFPDIATEPGKTHDDMLRELAFSGLERRELPKSEEVLKRLEYELEVIKTKGYAKYFLVVSDLLRYAHEHGILTTIRGSVAGSLATYLTGITNVNPLEYKLPFERFLNPERPSAPDIDMDFADTRRDEVIEYTRQKYGADKVAQIGTFGTMAARGAVRDVARALGYPYATGDRISKLIPMGSQGFPMTIDKALELEPELKKIYDKEPEVREIINMAKKIEGCARHISVHAAGVVISPDPLIEHVPLQYDPKGEGKLITQYDMHDVGEDGVGLLKFDFLGIRNLSILADAVKLVGDIENVHVDIEKIPLNDPKTFQMLARGETIGLFQLNGSGMTKALMELKPTSIHDINVMVALYRPGPMDNINDYIARKHGKQPISYMHPKMKNFLDTTYGVLVYQDDLLMTAIEVAGYTWGEVDKFRKAVGKKIPEEMAKQHIIFVDGCVKHGGMTKEKAEKIWQLFEPFQGYGFNKAHAASYGKVAYQTAYMKANFPALYMSAVLTADSGDIEKIAEIIAECRRMKIPVLPPDVNESFGGFTVIKGGSSNEDAIRFGLYTIKNVGEGIADVIIAERKKNGPYSTLAEFLTRIKDRNMNRKSLEALIKCGAMDKLGERQQMVENIDDLLRFNKESGGTENQDSLFGLMSDTSTVPTLRMKETPVAHIEAKLGWEKELLGLYISGHPLDKHKDKLDKVNMTIKEVKEGLKEGMMAVAYGILDEVKPILTKGGDKMIFVKISDFTGSIEAVVFPKTLKLYEQNFMPDTCVAIKGRLSQRNGVPSIVVEKAKSL
jgi:DNA polymerase-3 subunit alpha